MTNQEAIENFNNAIENTEDSNEIAKLELLREYFTNPEFKAALEQHTYEQEQNNN